MPGTGGGGKAQGGPVQAGRAYLVGENWEPELFIPTTSGMIKPAKHEVSQLGNLGGGEIPPSRTQINITNNINNDQARIFANSLIRRATRGRIDRAMGMG